MAKKKKKRWFGPYVIEQGGVGISQHKTLRGARRKLTNLKKMGQYGCKITKEYFIGKRRYTKTYPPKKR